ncbi:hypothetical protein Tcan_03703 [Toxocara canis]|uniref:Uncharacterized protein n=1 Tax=Toxocara canis TaxID=6265 RepID=A0A0B2VJG2_TOXCA|nr:hypothetical protein Tcan_03703 [Toxocara canis]
MSASSPELEDIVIAVHVPAAGTSKGPLLMMHHPLHIYFIAVANVALIAAVFMVATILGSTLRFRSVQNVVGDMQIVHDLTIYLLFGTFSFIVFVEVAKKAVDLKVVMSGIHHITEEVNRQNEEDELTVQRFMKDREVLEKLADENQQEEELKDALEVNEDVPLPPPTATTTSTVPKQAKPNEKRGRPAHSKMKIADKTAECKSSAETHFLVDATQETLEEVTKGLREDARRRRFEKPKSALREYCLDNIQPDMKAALPKEQNRDSLYAVVRKS